MCHTYEWQVPWYHPQKTVISLSERARWRRVDILYKRFFFKIMYRVYGFEEAVKDDLQCSQSVSFYPYTTYDKKKKKAMRIKVI